MITLLDSKPTRRELAWMTLCCIVISISTSALGQDRNSPLDRVVQKLTDHSYDLQYRFAKGDTLRYEIVHQVNVETTIDDVTQATVSHSRSVKQWRVLDVNADESSIEHSILSVNMWSEAGQGNAVKYNSETDAMAPPAYAAVAEMVGKPLAVVRTDARGNITERSDEKLDVDFGTGSMFVPLPAEPVRIGHQWSTPGSVRVRLADGDYKVMKTQQVYQLENVASGVASISVRTQVLTPVPDARVESQLVQKLTNGVIRFDLDAGRILSRQWNWNESVVGFSGAASQMKYMGQLTEQLVTEPEIARGTGSTPRER